MSAGNNIVATIWTFDYPSDDYVGGAQPTGTMAYQNISCRYEPLPPTIPLLEQGVETVKLFNFFINRADIVIKENDEVQINLPVNHMYANQYFRIISVQKTGFHPSDSRGFLRLITKRREEAHAIQQL
jgi:hypothetical protein